MINSTPLNGPVKILVDGKDVLLDKNLSYDAFVDLE
jgi:DtxR family Mn-dependent transcriptional regulator